MVSKSAWVCFFQDFLLQCLRYNISPIALINWILMVQDSFYDIILVLLQCQLFGCFFIWREFSTFKKCNYWSISPCGLVATCWSLPVLGVSFSPIVLAVAALTWAVLVSSVEGGFWDSICIALSRSMLDVKVHFLNDHSPSGQLCWWMWGVQQWCTGRMIC